MIDAVLLTAARVSTFEGDRPLTNASGFYFERDGRLYLVTSRHVMVDEPSGHTPDRIELELHTDPANLAASIGFSIPLYRSGFPLFRQGEDAAGEVDVATIEIDRRALPPRAALRPYNPSHLELSSQPTVGSPLAIVGFPLGFHDSLHHLPVVRHAVIASSFGLRFQGQGYFLTDARTHRGTSGAPVLMARPPATADDDLAWALLGVHSARIDLGTRDHTLDEALGLNCAWYADIVMTLTSA
jgi:hypothetical protein